MVLLIAVFTSPRAPSPFRYIDNILQSTLAQYLAIRNLPPSPGLYVKVAKRVGYGVADSILHYSPTVAPFKSFGVVRLVVRSSDATI